MESALTQVTGMGSATVLVSLASEGDVLELSTAGRGPLLDQEAGVGMRTSGLVACSRVGDFLAISFFLSTWGRTRGSSAEGRHCPRDTGGALSATEVYLLTCCGKFTDTISPNSWVLRRRVCWDLVEAKARNLPRSACFNNNRVSCYESHSCLTDVRLRICFTTHVRFTSLRNVLCFVRARAEFLDTHCSSHPSSVPTSLCLVGISLTV